MPEVIAMPQVVRSIEIPAPPSAVWRHLATADALRHWLHPSLEIDLRVGGTYRLHGFDPDTWISGTVLEIVPEGSLMLSWLEENGDWVHPTRLTITLAPTPAGTSVTITHDGFAGIGKPGWPDTVKAYEKGAARHGILERLAQRVAAEP
jgi:uncharacterized protein YndB with AHSA1/START domain